jgi:hypothetical protein
MENNNQEQSRVLSLAGVSFTKENPCGAEVQNPPSAPLLVKILYS